MTRMLRLLAAGLFEIIAFGQAQAESLNEYSVAVRTNSEIGQWHFDYKNANTLLRDTQSAAFRKLKIGSTGSVIYVVSRDDMHLRLVVVPNRAGSLMRLPRLSRMSMGKTWMTSDRPGRSFCQLYVSM